MTVPSGPDQPQRGYGSRSGQPQDSAGGTPAPAGQDQGQGPAPDPAPGQGSAPRLPAQYGSSAPAQFPGQPPQPSQPQYPQQYPQGAPQFPGQPGQPVPPQYQAGPGPQYQGYPQPPQQAPFGAPPQGQPQPQPGVPPYGAAAFPPPNASYGGWPQLQPAPVAHFNPAMLLPIQHWLRDRSLRNWITILFVALVVVPSIALVYVGQDEDKISKSTWAFAIYFACAWLLVLWISIRPPMVRPLMLLEVGVIGLLFEAPLAIWLEKKLETPNQNLFNYIFTVGLPEEFVKILPVLVLGFLLKQVWGPLTPKDYLFLGAVSGLAFGAAEAVQYINVYIPSQAASIAESAAQQNVDPASLGQFIAQTSIQSGSWRFVTDPMSHAVWAGITGYFVGLAFQHRRYFWLALVGLGLTSVLHGINDDVAGHWFWIVEIIVSVLLFMAYVQAGGVIEQQLTEADEAHARAHPHPAYPMPVPGGMPAPGWAAAPAPAAPGWAPVGYGTGSIPVAPSWNPAAGWGQSGFTPLRGYRAPNTSGQPAPPPQP